MALIRSIGGIIPDVTIDEVHTDEIELTQHPVQQGAAITDHKYKKPVSLKMSIMFGKGDILVTYQKLLDLQKADTLLDVVTGKRSYKNMQIRSLSVKTDKQTNTVLSVSLDLVEVIIVSVVVSKLPPRKRQKKAGKTGATEKAGEKSAQEVKKKSAIRSLLG